MGWTKEQAEAHNARIAAGHKQRTRPFIPTEYKKLAPEVTAVSLLADLKPSTDEQKLNKTEKAYLAHLRCTPLTWLGIQSVTLKLADDCRLTPDFAYISQATGRFVFIDVKGFQREDALIKMRVAARLFSWADFIIVKKNKNGWDHKPVKP